MPIQIPLQLIEEIPQIKEKETCLNFLHFRNLLKSHRSKCDDKIKQRLSSISNPKVQCPIFEENLRKAHESRLRNLKFCLSVLKDELGKDETLEARSILEKEVQFIEKIKSKFTYFINRKVYLNLNSLLKKLYVSKVKYYLIINVNLFKISYSQNDPANPVTLETGDEASQHFYCNLLSS